MDKQIGSKAGRQADS
jgi:hypothetical protein